MRISGLVLRTGELACLDGSLVGAAAYIRARSRLKSIVCVRFASRARHGTDALSEFAFFRLAARGFESNPAIAALILVPLLTIKGPARVWAMMFERINTVPEVVAEVLVPAQTFN